MPRSGAAAAFSSPARSEPERSRSTPPTTTSSSPNPSKNHISEYTASGSKVAGTIGEGLVPGGAFFVGLGVSAKTGNVYLSDLESSKVYVLNPAGTEILAEFDGSDSPRRRI